MTNGTSPCNNTVSQAATNWTNKIQQTTSSFNCTAMNVTETMIGPTSDQLGSVFDIIRNVHMYGTLIVVPVGVLMKILAIVTFIKSRMAWNAVGLHMLYLCIADNVVLVSVFIRTSSWWFYLIHIPDIYSLNTITCVGSNYVLEVGFTWSGFLLVSVTVERFLSIAFPLNVKSWNLYEKSKILMAIYLLLSLTLSGYTILGFEITTMDNTNMCVYSEKYQNIFYIGNMILNVVFANGLCFTLILVFTIMTTVALNNYKKKRAKLGFGSKDTGRQFRMTLMLLIVATLFLVLRVGEMIVHFLIIDKNLPDPVTEIALGVFPIFVLLLLINHAVNFVVYVIFLREFRRSFVGMFTWCRKQ